jgi:hypothetical protein
MKKFILAIALLFSQYVHAQVKFNGDFEIQDLNAGKPQGWLFSFDPSQEKAYRVKLDSTNKQSGKYSLSIENIGKEAGYGVINYSISQVYEGNSITLNGYIKTENVNTGYAGIWLRLDDADGEVINLENMQGKGPKGTTSWKKFSITMSYDADRVSTINVGGLLVGDGKAWLDNLEILINDKPLEQTKIHKRILTKAATDTSFKASSGIDNVQLNRQQIINLTITGQFWAFLKYHHPAIAKGQYNWDAELFRLLPAVMASKDNQMLSASLEQFLDKLPKPETCKDCPNISSEKYEIKPDYGELLNGSVLSASIKEKLNNIKDNRNIGPNYYVSMTSIGNPEFKNEKPYADMSYPDAGYRILSLYRLWAMINYFCPNRNIIGEDWNLVLSSALPDFVDAKNDMDYSLAVLKLISRVKDTHANLWGPNKALNDFRGKNAVPFKAIFVEGKLIITDLHTDTLDVKEKLAVGDIIYKINDVTVDELVKKYLPYTAASNYDTQLRNLPVDFLLRSNNDKIKLTIQRKEKFFDYTAPMGKSLLAYKDTRYDQVKAFTILDNNIGFVFPGKYKNDMLPEIKRIFSAVNSIIIDMRCYPSDFMPYTFGNYIKKEKSPFAKFTAGLVSYPGAFHFMKFNVENGGNSSFKGKIVIIVNASTQSQAEFTTMALQSSSNVTIIGSTTAGADGNVSYISLPGGLNTMISGLGVFYPDGGQTQRVGIRIDYKIYPTIKGIMEGRDELMEKAIEILNSKE